MNLGKKCLWVLVLVFFELHSMCYSKVFPMNCTDTSRLCTSFLAYKPRKNETIEIAESMFDVSPEHITVEGKGREYIFIRKNCSCGSTMVYTTNTTYTVRENSNELVSDLAYEAYGGLAVWTNVTRAAREGFVVNLRLICGCSSRIYNYLMSYVLEDGDSVESLSSRFDVSMDSIEAVNGIRNPENFTVGELYYIPLNSVPGEPYRDANIAPAPVPSSPVDSVTEIAHKKAHVPYGWIIIGCVGGALAFIIIGMIFFICLRSSRRFEGQESNGKDLDGKSSHKFQILRNRSFLCASGRYICCKSRDWRPNSGESSDRQMNIPKVIGPDVLEMEKPMVFNHEEIIFSTDSFSDTNLLGHGTYGSVYYGLLRDQEVAIKRMTATKTKEFMAEMKVLCRVHHTNLVELIGYAASQDELYLIYEYAQKGSLRSHLHDPHSKGHTSLSWIMRVQIALDAARGLEYIHEHTKAHYVHRDIKTSNILLDGAFRAKISDFGLAKLVGRTNDGEASATRVVGTFGYLAPEYMRDGLATSKSDVYAFGVILFEMISGKEAITRTEGTMMRNPERRSLVSIMLAALRNSPDSMSMASMKYHIDSNLMDLYPHDCLFKVAVLAKQCVDEDPILRPDMKQVVISLSQILLSSVEWEATLAGNSQIFSGLVQGR